MIFSYGKGEYIEDNKKFDGEIILGEHKLYVRTEEGDIAQTYVALERIERIKQMLTGVQIVVRPSILERYTVIIKGERNRLKELIKDIVDQRGFKKRLFLDEWINEDC